MAYIEVCVGIMYVHLTDGARDLCPYAFDVIIQPLERKDLQRRIRLTEEADEPSGGRQGDHVMRRSWAALWVSRDAVVTVGVVDVDDVDAFADADADADGVWFGEYSRGDATFSGVCE